MDSINSFDLCKAAVSKYVHDGNLRNMVHNEIDKISKGVLVEGNFIPDSFIVWNKEYVIASGTYDFCSDFVEKSKKCGHFSKKALASWEIIRKR